MAASGKFDRELSIGIAGYVKKNYPSLALSNPKTPTDLRRQFGRNISLLILDDEFAEKEEIIDLVKTLKTKRKSELIPVLFLTKNARQLVVDYHKHLILYQEADEYIQYTGIPKQNVYARIKIGIDTRNRRKSRRYNVNIPLRFFHLDQNREINGVLEDISIHGSILRASDDCLFRDCDQLKLNIPTADYIYLGEGDFLKLSARVRRVYISGTRVALSFEHMSDTQHYKLGKLLSVLVTRDMARKSGRGG